MGLRPQSAFLAAAFYGVCLRAVSVQEVHTVGDAAIQGDAIRLTAPKQDQAGAAWLREKQYIAAGFDTTFRFQLTEQGGFGPWKGADGFAFVMQNSGIDALGGYGSKGGFGAQIQGKGRAVIARSIAVFFDTHRNRTEGDPSSNYVVFRNYGREEGARWPAPRIAFVKRLPINLRDGTAHVARVLYRPPELSIFLDGSPVALLASVIDLSTVIDDHGKAWVGFTASTGAGFQNHDITSWSFTRTGAESSASVVSSSITFNMSACLPERHLCTPEKASVGTTPNGYHVVMPAHLKWGVSLPNVIGRHYFVSEAKGIVCLGEEAGAGNECSGPAGKGGAAGYDFIAPNEPAGALVIAERDGRTWFSVNMQRDAKPAGLQGFYEFDVESR